MEPYIGHILTVLLMLGGLAGVYVKISTRLTAIETRLQIDDNGKSDACKLRHAEMGERIRGHEMDCANYERNTGVITHPPTR